MTRSLTIIITVLMVLVLATSAFSYDFWGISLGTTEYNGKQQLSFNGVEKSGAKFVVGGYKYTQVDGNWNGEFAAATPGANYAASLKSDAEGLFFRADSDAARFMIIAGSSQDGLCAPEIGTDNRLFGPGDLKIDIGGKTYGVGLRNDNLKWNINPSTTNAEHMIYAADGTVLDLNARDAGTLGDIELNPEWARVGNHNIAKDKDLESAFFLSESGSKVGDASVSFGDTGISLSGGTGAFGYSASVYAYEVIVPWSVLGQSADDYSFSASFRPDCGNDIIAGNFDSKSPSSVPEPGSMVVLIGGLASLIGVNKLKK